MKQYYVKKKRLTFFMIIIATVLSCTYYLFRIGFENPLIVPIKALFLSYFVIGLPFLVSAFIYEKWKICNSFSSDASMSLACLGLALLAGYLGAPYASLIMLCGFGVGIWGILYAFKSRNTYQWGKYLLGMSVFAGSLTSLFWGNDYQNPLFFERIIVDGGKLDTIFHAAVANMLMTYDVPSSGLNGVVGLNYHYGSHWIMGMLASLIEIDVLTAYQLVYPVIFGVFFLSRTLSLAIDLLLIQGKGTKFFDKGVYYATLSAALYGILPKSILDKSAANWFSLFTSESYCFALAFSLLLLSILVLHKREQREKSFLYSVFLGIMVAANIFIIGFMKISVMCVVFAGIIYLFMRMKCYRFFSGWIALTMIIWGGITAFETTVGYNAQAGGGGLLRFEWFNFLKNYLSPFTVWNVILHFSLHYVWTIIFVAIRLRQENATSFNSIQEAVKNRKLIDVETILVMSVIGVVPGMTIELAGGAAYYFSDVQNWIALPLLLSLTKRNESITADSIRDWGKLKRWASLMIALFVLGNSCSFMVDAIKRNWQIRYTIIYESMMPVEIEMFKYDMVKEELKDKYQQRDIKECVDLLRKTNIDTNLIVQKCLFPQAALAQNRKYQMMEAIKGLGGLSKEEKRATLLYIPKKNEIYWLKIAQVAPMLAPALSGIAMVNGVPDSRVGVKAYGYDLFGGEENSVSAPLNDVQSKIELMGYKKLIQIEGTSVMK